MCVCVWLNIVFIVANNLCTFYLRGRSRDNLLNFKQILSVGKQLENDADLFLQQPPKTVSSCTTTIKQSSCSLLSRFSRQKII